MLTDDVVPVETTDLEELAGVGSWVYNVVTGKTYVSDVASRIVSPPDSAGPRGWTRWTAMIEPDGRRKFIGFVRQVLTSSGPTRVDVAIRATGGGREWLRIVGQAHRDVSGALTRAVGTVQDLTAERAATLDVLRSRDLLASVLEAATEQCIIATDRDGTVTVFNSGAERMLGYSAVEMLGRSTDVIHDPVEIRTRAAELGAVTGLAGFLLAAAEVYPTTRQCTYITKAGDRRQVLLTVTHMYGQDGTATGYMKIATDVTEKLLAQTAVESEARFRNTFEYAPSGMMLVALEAPVQGQLLHVNSALSEITGYPQDRLLSMNVDELTAPEHQPDILEKLHEVRSGRRDRVTVEQRWTHAHGHDVWVQVSMSPRANEKDHYVVTQVDDITGRKLVEQRLTHQVLHDGLTGLPNRLLLMDRITHALAASHRSRRKVGVLFIDLDGFKQVNDTAGHAVGDQVLIQVAQRLLRGLRPGDTVARLGGDEFVAVCPDLDSIDSVLTVAERVLASMRIPFEHSAQPFLLGCSIGISVSGADSTPEHLLHDADQAMYETKNAGRGHIRVGGSDLATVTTEPARSSRAVQIAAELVRAVDNDELIMFGQPVVDMRTGEITGVECLIRWNHPDRGLLEPKDFLDVAEQGAVIHPLGRRAVREACRVAATWATSDGGSRPPVHINISGRQLESGQLYHEVVNALGTYGLRPDEVVLEIAEKNVPLLTASLRDEVLRLRDMGVRIAIDDVGTGDISLSRFTALPVDILKIDIRFVHGLQDDPACAAVVRGVVGMAAALGLVVVAEGVETGDQADRLVSLGCTNAQGFLFGRPAAEDTLLSQLLGSTGVGNRQGLRV